MSIKTCAVLTTTLALFYSLHSIYTVENHVVENPTQRRFQPSGPNILDYIHKHYGSVCDGAKAAQDFLNRKGNHHCPDTKWRSLIQKYDPSPNKTILVSGCNNGMDAVEMYALFSHLNINEHFPNKTAWIKTLETTGKVPCGACNNCKKEVPLRLEPNIRVMKGRPQVYCIEAIKSSAERLAAAAETLGYSMHGFHVDHAAFTGSPHLRHVPFLEALSPFQENLGLLGVGKPVEAMTLDTWAQKENINIVDFLLLDLEGEDGAVPEDEAAVSAAEGGPTTRS